jgi:hypothetical protein
MMAGTPNELLERIRTENLNVYRASAQRLKEDVGQEAQIAQDYRGRLLYELLQNADDAILAVDPSEATVAFVLDKNDLWVANSGRPLDEADVRGLCGISASSKRHSGNRRASIGHKGMGFKSVLEITDAPEVYSTTVSFRFGPAEAVLAVNELVEEGFIHSVSRAPVTRFPWSIDSESTQWQELRSRGMTTAFRFPLRSTMTTDQREGLISTLRQLPVTSLVFLKHLGRVEVTISEVPFPVSLAWTVKRYKVTDAGATPVAEFSNSGTYRVALIPDEGTAESFLLAYAPGIEISNHRGGLDEISWEGVTETEVSVAVRMREEEPAALEPNWRKLHVFLPTGEPCPYDLLISGAFNSNLSRQEIRVEAAVSNYNRFLLKEVARTLCDMLIPRLLSEGSTASAILQLLDRRTAVGIQCTTLAAQALYEEVRHKLGSFPLIPSESKGFLPINACALPPLVPDVELGPAFRRLLHADASLGSRFFPVNEYCESKTAHVLADHGAYCLTPAEAAQVLGHADPPRSKLRISESEKIFVDPILTVLEKLWEGLRSTDRDQFVDAVRTQPLFPVGVTGDYIARRISTAGLMCFYPPRSLRGDVPLDGLCFLLQDICWGDLTPKERNQDLKQQLVAWQALFNVQEFKFPAVMRASVLPALDLDRDGDTSHDRQALHSMERIAAICQLAGRTSNPSSPLPYERLGTNRALFPLSRLDVPCRPGNGDGIQWVPAYRAYFGKDWIGNKSAECILETADAIGNKDLPEVYFLLSPSAFAGHLEKFLELNEENDDNALDIGADEVGVDEDEEFALEQDSQSRWLSFLQWIGVNQSLRPVHFHDVEDRASGWLKTSYLARPDGWIFRKIPQATWISYVDQVRSSIVERMSLEPAVPYFYQLHDLEHLVSILDAASKDVSAQLGRTLYEHLARNWSTLEAFSRAQIAVIPNGQVPAMRAKPARAKAEELVDVTPDFWMARLGQIAFCPTGHGPRQASHVWLPTLEVERRFGRRGKVGSSLVPSLEIDPSLLKGKARGFAQALGIRDELTPTTFSLEDARLLLERLRALYSEKFDAGDDAPQDLREVLRPAYRNLFELLASRDRHNDAGTLHEHPLAGSQLLATDGAGQYRFLETKHVFYADNRDTRERIGSDIVVWTFVLDALQGARASLINYFGVRVLEDALNWSPQPGDPALVPNDLILLRSSLNHLAPYILARIAADRSDERLARTDARRLRRLFTHLEPVTALRLGCKLEGTELNLGHFQRDSFVQLSAEGNPTQAFVVWGELPWPPESREAEALAGALCDVFGPGYFEPFLAMIQAKTTEMCERFLRRAGAPLDIDDRRGMFLGEDSDEGDDVLTDKPVEGLKTILPGSGAEQPAAFPDSNDLQSSKGMPPSIPLYSSEQLFVDGEPILILGEGARPTGKGKMSTPNAKAGNGSTAASGYGGHTDLELLNNIGMSVALSYEQSRLRRLGFLKASIFNPSSEHDQPDVLIFDVSSASKIAKARRASSLLVGYSSAIAGAFRNSSSRSVNGCALALGFSVPFAPARSSHPS